MGEILRIINLIVVHCSATKPTMDIGVAEIRQWHTDPPPKGRGWNDIGYHFVIRREGAVEKGRPIDTVGAHVEGHNANSIGICLVGGIDAKGKPESNFLPEQWKALEHLLVALTLKYPNVRICGHRDLNPGKDCPSFSVPAWLEKIESLRRYA